VKEPYVPKPATITLDPEEALVLYDFLERWEQRGDESLSSADHPERVVLWNLLALLEEALVEPLLEDYGERVDRARALLVEKYGDEHRGDSDRLAKR
jgi:hypothetical protein